MTDREFKLEMLKLRFDYAWKDFDLAMRHRALFFNYFLIAVGILASAFGFAVKEGQLPVAIFISVFGVVASIGAIVFDFREQRFMMRARSVLETLERQGIFPDGFLSIDPAGQKGEQLGLTRLDPDAKGARKVGWWIGGIELLAAVGFILGIVYVAWFVTTTCCGCRC